MVLILNVLRDFSASSGIFFVTKGTFGQLTCEWQYLFEEFTKDPMIVEHRRLRIEAKVETLPPSIMLSKSVQICRSPVDLSFLLKERVKSVFHAKEFGKIINFRTPEIAKVGSARGPPPAPRHTLAIKCLSSLPQWVLAKLDDARENLPK